MPEGRDGGEEQRYPGVQAVGRALAILDCFQEGDDGLTLSEIARRTGLYKSTALRLVETLCAWRYLQKGPDGLYRIGPAPFYLGRLYRLSFHLGDIVQPLLKRLVAETGETASVYVRDGDERICLYRLESPRSVRHSVVEGKRLPLRAGAAGKALLAFSGEEGEVFDAIRARGFAVSVGERDPFVAAIAAPLRRGEVELVGVLALSGPRERFRPHEDPRVQELIKAVAAEGSAALGWRGEAATG